MFIYLQMIETDEDKSRFEQIYLKHRGLMFNCAIRLLRNRQDAEDAVHQAFLSIAKNISKVSDVDCPQTRSFCVIITERKAIDIIRQRNKVLDTDFDENIAGVYVPPPGDSGLADAMAALPPRYRQALLLRFDNGYSTWEMASILGMSRGAVQKLLWRAKEELRKRLEEDESE